MKTLVPLLAAMALAGCVKSDPAFTAAGVTRVHTVDEFLTQPELRRKVLAICANNPGQNEQDANCINVLAAERIASAGTTIPSIIR